MKKPVKSSKSATPQAAELRRRAEEKARSLKQKEPEALSPEETQQRLHELRVHKIELEMQNEELRRAQTELDASRARYFDLYNLAPVGYLTISEPGLILEANLTAATLLGMTRQALVRQLLTQFILNDDQDIYYLHRKQLFETCAPQVCELRMLSRKGHQFWAHLTATTAKDEGGAPLCRAVIIDITKKKQAEDVLKISEDNYRMIFDTANDAIFLHDVTDGRILDVNKKMCEMYSYSHEEALKIDIAAVSEGNPPYSQDEAAEKVRRALVEGPQLFEWKAKDKFGNIFWVEVNLKLVVIANKPLILALVRDIRDRKKAENDKLNLERQLHHSQKMESLGILAGGIAHDFNNILMAILGNSELGLMNVSDVSPARPRFEAINASSMRAAEICKQMLAYSGRGRFMIGMIDLTEVIHEMSHMLTVSVSKKVILEYNLAKGLPQIEADMSQIQQIIMNLTINASESIGEGSGAIYIKTGMLKCDREYLHEAQLEIDINEGNYVFLEITDTGCGMDKDTISKIFDPFFTTKFIGRGLGMAAVHGIIRSHKGGIKIYSEPGKGTTFRVLLPAAENPAEDASSIGKKEEEGIFKGDGTILLVDDEETIRSIARDMLERMGFSVFSAADGMEALEIFRKYNFQISCVILDLAMPNMDGEETFNEMRLIRTDIPIIMSSGYNEREVAHRFLGKDMSGFIQKPYRISDLEEVLKKVIGR